MHSLRLLLSLDQTEFVESLIAALNASPGVSARYKRGHSASTLRFVLARLLLLLDIQTRADLWQLCDINTYDKIPQLDAADSSMRRICNTKDVDATTAFHCVVRNLTAMRYLSTKEQSLAFVGGKPFPLTYAQRLLRGLIIDAFWQNQSLSHPISAFLSARLRTAVAYFIALLNLQGPQDLPAFFALENYAMVARQLETVTSYTNPSYPYSLIKCLSVYIQPTLFAAPGGPSALFQKILLAPPQILSALLATAKTHPRSLTNLPPLEGTEKPYVFRLARIKARKLPPAITHPLHQWYMNVNTRKKIHLALRYLIEYAAITTPEELTSYETFERFYQNLSQQDGITQNHIHALFTDLSSFLQKAIKSHLPIDGVLLERDFARAVLERYRLTSQCKHYKCRDQDEVELWISTLPTAEERAIWALYAEGLRRIEVLPRPDPYDPKKWIGLSWSNIDPTNCCLTSIRRKKLRNGPGNHPFIRLSEVTVQLLEDHHRTSARKQFCFSINPTRLRKDYLRHFQRLQQWLARLEAAPTAAPHVLTTLQKLIHRGHITPHQLRRTWNTLATENKIQFEYKRYHMHHAQRGGDRVYLEISERPAAYFAEYDRAAPKYIFDFSLAEQVYPKLFPEDSSTRRRSPPSKSKSQSKPRQVPFWIARLPCEEAPA
ncbi:MAG: hypothetical protein ACE5OZ_04285 [Candidatus Heimdallarchaeota archaeon]